MTCAMILFVLLGTPAGYVSARVYKSFGGVKWKSNVLLTSIFSPGIVFGLFFVMNLVLWDEESSGAVPFSTLVAILALWFGVSVPLTFVGAYFGFRKRSLEHPVRTNQIPRQIPDQSIYTQPIPGIIMGGVLPFGELIHYRLNNLELTFDCPFRMHLHSTVLYLELFVVKPNVLHVRILVPGVLDLGHHLLGDDSAAVLLPSMCGGLSLVVAKFPNFRLHSCLPVRLLLSLLCHQASN